MAVPLGSKFGGQALPRVLAMGWDGEGRGECWVVPELLVVPGPSYVVAGTWLGSAWALPEPLGGVTGAVTRKKGVQC